MTKGVLFGFLTYVLFSCADASVKAIGGTMPVFEISFFITLASLSTFGFARSKSERWREAFLLNRPGLVFLRAICGYGRHCSPSTPSPPFRSQKPIPCSS